MFMSMVSCGERGPERDTSGWPGNHTKKHTKQLNRNLEKSHERVEKTLVAKKGLIPAKQGYTELETIKQHAKSVATVPAPSQGGYTAKMSTRL